MSTYSIDPTDPDVPRLKFCHLRFYDEKKTRNNPKGISGRGGATIAYRRSNDGMRLEFAITLCNRKDNFSRRLGRIISSNFVDDDKKYEYTVQPSVTDGEYLSLLMVPKAIAMCVTHNAGKLTKDFIETYLK